ncbi:MAG: hypothetical protein ACRCX7_11080 [Cetobacterium sp.]|uniref:hypothetical protein n=1 Tax=Cetobacterium sp. TaxID=2071632 RepID=UPI003F3720B6
MARPAVYKQSKVIFSVNGVPMEDIAEDESITVDYDRERITKQLDIHEGGIFSLRSGKPARITVPVLQHSRWISLLSAYRNAEAMVAISLEDKNDYGNAQVFVSAHAMIQDPNVEYGTEASSRSFAFEIIHLSDVVLPE